MLTAAAGVGAAGLAGCSWRADQPEPLPPDPLAPLLADTRRLAARYQEVLAAQPALAAQLAALRDAHLAHVAALVELLGTNAGPATPTAPESPTPTGPPERAAALLADLAEREQAAYAEASAACLSAPPQRAALLGSIAAARATHVVVLTA